MVTIQVLFLHYYPNFMAAGGGIFPGQKISVIIFVAIIFMLFIEYRWILPFWITNDPVNPHLYYILKKKWNWGKLSNTQPLVCILLNNRSILYFSDSFFQLLHQGLKLVARCSTIASWNVADKVSVKWWFCLCSCGVPGTNWKYKWENIGCTFSPSLVDSLIDYTQIFMSPLG